MQDKIGGDLVLRREERAGGRGEDKGRRRSAALFELFRDLDRSGV